MKIFLICSKSFYGKIDYYKKELEAIGHQIFLPNCYDAPETEARFRGTKEHAEWKARMIKHSEDVIKNIDAVLVLNFDKNGQKNYIGGATFLEIYDAFRLGKKIFFINELPEGMLKDELIGFSPIILNGDLSAFKPQEVVVGGKYKHYKGGEYVVLQVAENTENNEKMVVYKALYGEEKVWVRPYSMFTERIFCKNQSFRFERID